MQNKNRATVLIVDDECHTQKMRPLIKRLSEKYNLLPPQPTIQNAEHHFNYDKHSIDCIILDIYFGQAEQDSGLKMLTKIRNVDPDLPVGIITQYDKTSSAFKAGQNLASFYCPKEFKNKILSDSFLDQLEKLIDNSIKNANFMYDRDLMKKINEDLSFTYDIEELSRPGTIAFLHWEDSIIEKTLSDLLKDCNKKTLKILDVCCGTGRYELLVVDWYRRIKRRIKDKLFELEIIGMDFSGRMLSIAKRKLEDMGVFPDSSDTPVKVKLKRGFAEKLPFSDPQFDFVICGFGVPSYTKFNLSIPEVYRVLRSGGKALFTVYNKNALRNKIQEKLTPDISPLASWVKFKSFEQNSNQGVYYLIPQGADDKKFPIQAFSKKELMDVLNRFGFEVKWIGTFPILYSITPLNLIPKNPTDKKAIPSRYNLPKLDIYIKELKESVRRVNFLDEKYFNKKKSEIEKAHKSAEERVKKFPYCSSYYNLDKDYAERIEDGGFYITAVAQKVTLDKDREEQHE